MKTLTGNRTFIYDGARIKSLNPWDVDDSAGWTSLSGTASTVADTYRTTSAVLFRCFELRAGAVARMPFEIMRGENVYDSSQEYANELGWLPNPQRLMYLTEAALCAYGAAYWLKIASRVMVKELKYFVPPSVQPKIDERMGLTGFERSAGNVTVKFKPEEMLYFWPADPGVELGPAKAYPLMAASHAVGVLINVDEFAAAFFERGAIKATVLAVKGNPVEAERQRLKTWWSKMMTGIKNAFAAEVVNADLVTATQIGEGLESLKDTELTTGAQQDIAVAFGIPFSILFSNAANYATSQQDWSNFYQTTIEPECNFIASVLNQQLFEPLGFHINFLPETLDIYQEDENARAGSLKSLVDSGVPLLMAMDLLGFELTDEQRAELEAEEAEPEPTPPQLLPFTGQPPAEQPEAEDELQEELAKWQRKSLNALKRGKSPCVEFESVIIPVEMGAEICDRLSSAVSQDDVREAFRVKVRKSESATEADYADLLAELKRANDLLEASTA